MNQLNGLAAAGPRAHREFAFGNEDFNALRAIVKAHTGINLTDAKRELVYGRLSRRLRALGLAGFREYRDYLEQDSGQELVELCNAITTNLTSFFREAHHFEYLTEHLQRLAARPPGASRRLRIWSAGCSTGEEPYSIAMTICDALPDRRLWDIRILATDIDSAVLAHASKGEYAKERIGNMAKARVAKYFTPNRAADPTHYRVNRELADMIVFKQLNLMEPLPMRGPLEAVFCRNVIIYFDKVTQQALFSRIAPLQQQDALLFLGHSESLFKVSDDYELLGKTIYRKKAP